MIMRGYVNWFNSEEGFGFIIVEGESDVFVHFSDINTDGYKNLNEDDYVEFELEEKPVRCAKNVTIIG